MTSLAVRMLRHRPGPALATLIALAVGALILTAMGVLVESGVRFRPMPDRYAAADLVVARPDTTFTSKEFDGETTTSTVALPEGGTVPADLVEKVRAVPGVATAVAEHSVPVVLSGAPVTGRAWGSAVLTPYRMVSGEPPAAADQVVLDQRLAAAPGDPVDLVVGGESRTFRVSGTAAAGTGVPPAVFFTDARAAELSPHPGRVTAIGVLAAPGSDVDSLKKSIGAVAGDASVLTGDDRGKVERSADRSAADLLIQVGASFGGYVVLLIVFVVAATVGLSVRHRRRDLALVRAVAATPGQVRRMITAEAALLSLAAAVLGVPAGLAAAHWLTGELTGRGFLPDGFPMAPGLLAAPAAALVIALSATAAGLLAARRVTAIRPVEALGEAGAEPAEPGRIRLISGLVTMVGAISAGGTALVATGETALASAIGMLYLFVLAVALLAPWINRTAARVLARPLRAAWGTSGYLAAANLRANSRGMATVLTSLVLAVGFGGSVWFLQDNLERQALADGRDGMVAQHALVAPGGLAPGVADELRAVPGVTAVTPVTRTAVVVKIFTDGQTVAARAVDPRDLASTLDLDVRDGDLARLGEGTVAVSRMQAASMGWDVGDEVEMRLGDGTPIKPRVVAVYGRGLGFGDVLLDRRTVAGHTATGLDSEVLIAASPEAVDGLREVAARHPGSVLAGSAELTNGLAADLALSAWLNRLLIGVMVGYAALAAANTMVMAALARRRELAVLRLTGVTRGQVKRMVHAEQTGLLGSAVLLGGSIAALTLTAVVYAVTGQPVPYVPPLGWAIVLGGAALLALATTILPIGRLLRVAPVEHMGVRE